MNRLIILSLLIASASARAEERFTPEQLDARFYYDLGPKEVDVTSYPEEQRDNYWVFIKTCGRCHTLARPLNSPRVTREDWRRYVRRMRQKAKMRTGPALDKHDAQAAIDFLTYDAQVRKVKGKAAFAAKTEELKALFAEVLKERARIQRESDKTKIREPAPYMGGR